MLKNCGTFEEKNGENLQKLRFAHKVLKKKKVFSKEESKRHKPKGNGNGPFKRLILRRYESTHDFAAAVHIAKSALL